MNNKANNAKHMKLDSKIQYERGHLSLFESFGHKVHVRVFSYLSWSDSINLDRTCKKMNQVNFWKLKTDDEFDVDEYLINGQCPLENVLTLFESHMHVLSVSLRNISEVVIKKCRNVKSLRIPHDSGWRNDPTTSALINTWIKELNLESLWFSQSGRFVELCSGVTNLNELCLKRNYEIDFSKFLRSNTEVERLSVALGGYYNLNIFGSLPKLRCLHIKTDNNDRLGNLLKFGKLSQLTECSIIYYMNNYGVEMLNSFLQHLAKKTKLNKLHIETFVSDPSINGQTFELLKHFNVSALSLRCRFTGNDFIQFIIERPLPRLKHLQLRGRSNQEIIALVRYFKNVELICCSVGIDEYDRFNNAFINEILDTSNDRQPLTLEIHTWEYRKRIEFRFKSQYVEVTEREVHDKSAFSS